jgi:ABC-type nickel/cobalt efflux system permease component RcnA
VGDLDRRDLSAEPLALYPPDDDGFDLALEHFRRLGRAARSRAKPRLDVLRWVAITAGGLWIVSSAVTRLVFAIQWPRGPTGFDAVFAWSQAIEVTAYPAFVVSVGMYVVLWLRGRQQP